MISNIIHHHAAHAIQYYFVHSFNQSIKYVYSIIIENGNTHPNIINRFVLEYN